MRRAFTLIELLVIVAIIGAMVTVAVVSVQKGQGYARMRGSVRTVFATVRQARSIALVSQKPSIITFSTAKTDGEVVSKVAITSAKLMESKDGVRARSLSGVWRVLGDEEVPAVAQTAQRSSSDPGTEASLPDRSGGVTSEEILFAPVSEDVLSGICIKVVMDEEEQEDSFSGVNEVKRSRISVFSNADFLLQNFSKASEENRKREDKAKADDVSLPVVSTEVVEEEKSVVWQINGRCEPHTVYIYPEGGSIEDAWKLRVDRFGGVKVLDDGEYWN